MNHDTCLQSYAREHNFQPLAQALTFVCVYCGQCRSVNDDGTIVIVRPGRKQTYNYEPAPKPSTTDQAS